MAQGITKLNPRHDLQCYFERPSAIAAISSATETGFVLSGSWRQQFDWAVVEWNRDNVFEHPALRNLPDGDLSGLKLTYEEERQNCIPADSELYPTVDWPFLRLWTDEDFYQVELKSYAQAVAGEFRRATAQFELRGDVVPGGYIGLSCGADHFTHQVLSTDTPDVVIQSIANSVNTFGRGLTASAEGTVITLKLRDSLGANGNRVGAYGFSTAGAVWRNQFAQFQGGTSPTRWKFELDFSRLTDRLGRSVPAFGLRKIRWTYAADQQRSAFVRGEFAVVISNWSVSGTGRDYQVAGAGSIRFEDDHAQMNYSGSWTTATGNFSGGSLHVANAPGARVRLRYEMSSAHNLYFGSRYTPSAPKVAIKIDGKLVNSRQLRLAGEDVLARIPLGRLAAGVHEFELTHDGTVGEMLYFDFLEAACPSSRLPNTQAQARLTLATDWDTDHSLALPAERTAWLLEQLGFQGRANHYVGALWFYELVRTGHQYASWQTSFNGQVTPNAVTVMRIGTIGTGPEADAVINHVHRAGDTPETLVYAFAQQINDGYTSVWAAVAGRTITIQARLMGKLGEKVRISVETADSALLIDRSSGALQRGIDGDWRTDLNAQPRLNRAVRDWNRAYLAALKRAGIDAAVAFSMELQHGDPDPAIGLAQRYPSGNPVVLNTPAMQTNFSSVSQQFWREVYADAAVGMIEAGVTPYLQFGEVQWWYFPYDKSGLPFYDAATQAGFIAQHGRPLPVIASASVDPLAYPDVVRYLAGLVGEFTDAVMAFVRQRVPQCRFEVLYPVDVNDQPFTRAVNLPRERWTSGALTCLKTESFTYTGSRRMDVIQTSVSFAKNLGFPAMQRSHLVGIESAQSPWQREVAMALSEQAESVVLFALDQYCLIGYRDVGPAWLKSAYQG